MNELETVKQEIKDLFSLNSGNYEPTPEEVRAVDIGLDKILGQIYKETGEMTCTR